MIISRGEKHIDMKNIEQSEGVEGEERGRAGGGCFRPWHFFQSQEPMEPLGNGKAHILNNSVMMGSRPDAFCTWPFVVGPGR